MRFFPLVFLVVCAVRILAHDVIGYLPGYRINDGKLPSIASCTDVIYFGSSLEKDGRIKLPEDAKEDLASLKKECVRNKVRMILCLGGWANDKHFAAVSASAGSRDRFAASLAALVDEHHFDGVDLDWEYPRDAAQWNDLGKLAEAGKAGVKRAPFLWTVAVNPRHTIPAEVVAMLDRIHLMTYDAGKEHCHPSVAEAAIKSWVDRGVDSRKLCIGVAFYGRKMSQREDVKTYADLVREFGKEASATQTVGGYYYDSPASCRAKRKMVEDGGLRGLIVWEIGQDAPGDDALLPLLP